VQLLLTNQDVHLCEAVVALYNLEVVLLFLHAASVSVVDNTKSCVFFG
jgi:hypothetical protein